jgi:hypothetical protein
MFNKKACHTQLIKNSQFPYLKVLMITITTNLKKSVSFLSDFCFNQNKIKLCSLHSSAFFMILNEGTNPITETNNTSYKALLLRFQDQEGEARGITMGGPPPHPVTFFMPFLSEVMQAK